MSLPIDAQQEDLLALFAQAIAKLGLRRVPLVEPTPAFFPDPYSPTLPVAGALISRCLRFAGIDLRPELVDGRGPYEIIDAERLAVTWPKILFLAVEDGRATFQVDAFGPGDLTAARICHEVARVSLGANADDEVVAAATIIHGFGLITVPAASSLRRSSVIRGDQVITRQNLVLTGALSPGELAFLLAAWLVLRGADEGALVERHLDKEAAGNVRAWIEALSPFRRQLRDRLRLPWSDERMLAEIPKIDPPPAELTARWQKAEDARRWPNQDRQAVRRWTRKTGRYTAGGVVLGAIAAIALLNTTLAPWLGWSALAAWVVAGVLIGRSLRQYACGLCRAEVFRKEKSCPRCGARLEGDAPALSGAAVIEELDDDDELVRAALAAAPLEEAEHEELRAG